MTQRSALRFRLWRHWPWLRWLMALTLVLVAAVLRLNEPEHELLNSEVVVTAARDLPAGHALTAADLGTARHTSGLPVRQESQLVGKVLRGPVDAAEPLTWSRLVPARDIQGTSGMVIVPLRVGDPAAARLLVAGDRVDVYAHDAVDGNAPEKLGKSLEVLTVTTQADDSMSASAPATAMLSVPDGAAAKLVSIGDKTTSIVIR
jgi:Flp pilus assembly protein CpaB